jgi:hypothetical protein
MDLSSTCHTLRSCLASTAPRIIFRLAASASRIFFRPSPHFLVAAVARQIGAWASRSEENALALRDACRGGMPRLMDLCLTHAEGVTMQRIRELHALRFSTINPVVNLIDQCIGKQWYATPDFWNGGVDDAYTVYADPPENFFHLAIYGGLFGHAFDALLDLSSPSSTRSATRLAADVDTRLEFIKYCIPDPMCYACQFGLRDVTNPDGTIDPRRACQAIGPYQSLDKFVPNQAFQLIEHGNQLAVLHLLKSSRWAPSWTAVRKAVGGDFEVEWKQRLWEMVVWCQGLEGMDMIRPGGVEKWAERLCGWRKGIEKMETEPGMVRVGKDKTYYEYPCLVEDLKICYIGYWGGPAMLL